MNWEKNRYVSMRLPLLLAFLFWTSSGFAAEESSFQPITPKAARAIQALELRKTKNFVQQYKRVDEFSCKDELAGLKKTYARQRRFFLESENILDTEKQGQVKFPSLSPQERAKLAPLFPESFTGFVAQLNRKEIAGNELPLLLSTISRETDFEIFLDEDTDSTVTTGKGARPGAGLFQMTAWTPEFVEKWGPHNYTTYETERLKEVMREFSPDTPRATVEFLAKWLPVKVDLESTKDKIVTADQFVRSPYNPVASFWFGRSEVEKSERALAAMGLPDLRGSDRTAIIGAFYNGGAGRIRCALERVRKWNEFWESVDIQFEPQAYRFEEKEWRSLRSMIYLDKEMMRKAALPEQLVTKLETACKGKPGCSCLDQESPGSKKNVLKGNDFKGAVLTTYGDHMELLHGCYQDFVTDNQLVLDPDLPEACRTDLK